ncbi:transposase family protein [Actinomyces sp.]|uniref:transposase family protein n=1 Tax=Actinomyces sp. TaxID=29317 RepID=UPI0026DC9058|nr:transposase family protein [Actinomyces sp.]MDO4901690.1 transposase family protein [Actinomyces sp.]
MPGLFSGKYRTTGLNVQVACTPTGALVWVSDPLPASVHDATALRASGLLEVPAEDLPPGQDAPRHIGDKGYTGLGMTTPIKKLPGLALHEADKAFNTSVNRIRYVVERAIANLKTSCVLHTGYRRPIQTFPTTITATLALTFTYTP